MYGACNMYHKLILLASPVKAVVWYEPWLKPDHECLALSYMGMNMGMDADVGWGVGQKDAHLGGVGEEEEAGQQPPAPATHYCCHPGAIAQACKHSMTESKSTISIRVYWTFKQIR